MIQRLRLLLVTLFSLYCSPTFALSLGEIELKSSLNQRFDAEIVLSNVGDLEQGELISGLADQQDFDRVGVNRDYHLTDLRFNARVREDGTHIVHITSSKPIIEPFLNFIVEAIWPTGRILREYIVLLDPPVFSGGGIEKIESGMSNGSTSPVSAPTRSRSNNRLEIPPAPSVSNGRTEGVVTQDEEYGLTGPGDTLWTIALKVRPNNSISVQQTMLALQRANPEAFINNNINLLKAGHVLQIPDEREINAATSTEAVAEVRAQNQRYEDYRSGDVTQLDARPSASRSSADLDDRDNGELKLLAADQSGVRSGRDDARTDELENSLAVAREDLDRSRRANSELNVRLAGIDEQVETLNELVKLKDDQLAALRAELQRKAADTSSQPTAPVVVQQQASGSLLSNRLVLGGVGVLLIGLVAGALIMFRKRRQDSQLDDNEFTELVIEEAKPQLSLRDDAEESLKEDSEYNDEDVTPQTSDVIGEAEIYIAYGRFPQAISFLQNAIENEPERTDIQLRLLEIYVQTEDAAAFNLQYEQLKLLEDDEATLEGARLQAAMDAAIVSSEPIAAIEDTGVDDDDLSFDIDYLDAETDEEDLDFTADSGEELSLYDVDLDIGDDAGTDAGLDLDLDDDEGLYLDLDDDDALDLEPSDDDSLELGDDALELDLDDDGPLNLDLDDDDPLNLDLDHDDPLDLDLGDDDSLELGDDDDEEIDLDEDTSSKLDLARAYIEMGDNDGARPLLQEILAEGDDAQVSEANELLDNISGEA